VEEKENVLKSKVDISGFRGGGNPLPPPPEWFQGGGNPLPPPPE